MPDVPIPIPDPVTPNRIGLRELTVRTSTRETAIPNGPTYPAGTVSVGITPGEWADEVYVRDRDAVRIPDVAAWLGALAADADPLTAAAVERFQRAQADLLWLTRLRLSQDGACARPTA